MRKVDSCFKIMVSGFAEQETLFLFMVPNEILGQNHKFELWLCEKGVTRIVIFPFGFCCSVCYNIKLSHETRNTKHRMIFAYTFVTFETRKRKQETKTIFAYTLISSEFNGSTSCNFF